MTDILQEFNHNQINIIDWPEKLESENDIDLFNQVMEIFTKTDSNKVASL